MKYFAAIIFFIIWCLTTIILGAMLLLPLMIVCMESDEWIEIPSRILKVFEK